MSFPHEVDYLEAVKGSVEQFVAWLMKDNANFLFELDEEINNNNACARDEVLKEKTYYQNLISQNIDAFIEKLRDISFDPYYGYGFLTLEDYKDADLLRLLCTTTSCVLIAKAKLLQSCCMEKRADEKCSHLSYGGSVCVRPLGDDCFNDYN